MYYIGLILMNLTYLTVPPKYQKGRDLAQRTATAESAFACQLSQKLQAKIWLKGLTQNPHTFLPRASAPEMLKHHAFL